MPYLETPFWAKYVLNTLYILAYIMVIISGLALLIIPPNDHFTPILVEGILVGASVLAIYAIVTRKTQWEWAAIWFVIGGIAAYVATDIYDVISELLVGGGMVKDLLLEACVASVALLFLLARGVLLTVAVQKNRAFRNLEV